LVRIPFESLIFSKKKLGQPVYLLEKYRIKYLQSASLLSILRKHYTRESTSNDFIGFGDRVYDYENFKQGKPEQGSMKILATESTEVTDSIFSHEDTRSDTKEKRLSSVSSVAIEDEIKEIHRDRYARAGGIMARLPHSGEEIKTIARLFEKNSLKSISYLREQADEENAKADNMKDFDYIHFSCHGLLNDDFQSLVLSQLPPDKSKEDGYFTLNEIMNCDYNAKLVVLSACETGIGKMYKGEGVTGLTRAVMYAGTPAVVASLWKVDDIATKELMVNFYRYMLEKKMDKVEALRQAKLELLKNKNYSNPLYWSAFVMYGE
jgi:CHAT domain-containing protein